ncbi:MAG TPA: nucleotidyltransferase substrate binding protein [Thermotogota bacterium]|nr:nucleotidyltransferase substrate binding protein [Thermotogota bacterium]HPR97082.1 nucleotidyltransferase substrate binding protein [Thermotogota bacterium]
MTKNIRWIQRFNNFEKALNRLQSAVDMYQTRGLTDLEKQGMIQAFEFTHELSWKTMKDFLENRGNQDIFGSKDATRLSFTLGLIKDGEVWMDMIKSRNLSSHTYDENIAEKLVVRIVNEYVSEFEELKRNLKQYIDEGC